MKEERLQDPREATNGAEPPRHSVDVALAAAEVRSLGGLGAERDCPHDSEQVSTETYSFARRVVLTDPPSTVLPQGNDESAVESALVVGPSPLLPGGNIVPSGGDLTPCISYKVKPYRTNNRFYFLREIGGPDCLRQHLLDISASGPDNGVTIIIDQPCTLTRGIVIPPQCTLSGVGIDGAGRLEFNLNKNEPAITFPEPNGRSLGTISDIAIVNVGNGNRTGISFENQAYYGFVRRVMMTGWNRAIDAVGVQSTIIEGCSFEDNEEHVSLGDLAFNFRIRDNVFSGASGAAAIHISAGGVLNGGGNGHVIMGNHFSGSAAHAILIENGIASTTIIGNYFDGANEHVFVGQDARYIRILSNHFEGGAEFAFETDDLASILGVGLHQYAFNSLPDALAQVRVVKEGMAVSSLRAIAITLEGVTEP